MQTPELKKEKEGREGGREGRMDGKDSFRQGLCLCRQWPQGLCACVYGWLEQISVCPYTWGFPSDGIH